MSSSPESAGHGSILRSIAPLRHLTEQNKSNVHLRTVEALSEEFRRLLLRREGIDVGTALEEATEVFSLLYGLHAEHIERHARHLREQTITGATETMIEEGCTSPLYLASFARAARIEMKRRITRRALVWTLDGTHPDVSPLALPGREKNGENNHTFLLHNAYRNFLRLPGIEPSIDYDELHRWHLYRFTHASVPNDFVSEILAYRNGPRGSEAIIKGKSVLTLGPGRGRDEECMLKQGDVASVDMIEGSPFMLQRLEKTRSKLPPQIADRFRVPKEPTNMLTSLQTFAADGRRFDTIYSHSSLHYFDDEMLRELLTAIKECLKPNGHFALAVKAPGAVLDGNGIPLLQDIETLSSSRGEYFSQERVRHRMWLNFDGQVRVFRDKAVWLELLREHFAVPRVTEHSVERYETDTQRAQTFCYFICKRLEESPRKGRKRQAN